MIASLPSPSPSCPKTAFFALLATLLFASVSWSHVYDFELVNNGAVIVNNDNGNDTVFPSVIKVPDWVDVADRPDPNANYYLDGQSLVH